jgi:hypothetical protein
VLHEALLGESPEYHVGVVMRSSDPELLTRVCQADDPGCVHPTGRATYQLTLHEQVLSAPGGAGPFTYFDRAVVTRDR